MARKFAGGRTAPGQFSPLLNTDANIIVLFFCFSFRAGNRKFSELRYLLVGESAKKESLGPFFLPSLRAYAWLAGLDSGFELFTFEGQMPLLRQKNLFTISLS